MRSIKLLRTVVKMMFHIVLSVLDIFEECNKYRA